jgi:hypothetical protein
VLAQRGLQAQGGRDSGLPGGCPEGLLSIHTGAQGGECMIDEWPEAGKSSLSPFPFQGLDTAYLNRWADRLGLTTLYQEVRQ